MGWENMRFSERFATVESHSEVATVDTAPVAAGPTRVAALDALRGFAILAMVMAGIVPRGVLPAWMYHAQESPLPHYPNLHPAGLTWPDLVFPIFLFTDGSGDPTRKPRDHWSGSLARTGNRRKKPSNASNHVPVVGSALMFHGLIWAT